MDQPISSYSLENPLAPQPQPPPTEGIHPSAAIYEDALTLGRELEERPLRGGGLDRVRVQHAKSRMTVFERLEVLSKREPNLLWHNWGPGLDGASIVTGILRVGERDVAVYGHDFTLRAGSMDATNGAKLARLIYMAAERGIPLIGMNDSAGAFVPAGVGGLDGYSEAFTALRKISGVVPSISLMFGYNAGGGAYLPRQGSFMIQAEETFIGLTGPGVVKSALGEDVTADDLGGPGVHGMNGVCDVTTNDELGSLRTAIRLLGYLPDNNHVARLGTLIAERELPTVCEARCGLLADIDVNERADTIIYLDVLEHIQDDEGEMRVAAARLAKGGHIVVLSPAFNFLYSPFDKAVGHYRRYVPKDAGRLTSSSLTLKRVFFLDSVGYFVSAANRLVMRSSQPSSHQIQFWDKTIVPVSTLADKIYSRLFGRSVVMVWQRT